MISSYVDRKPLPEQAVELAYETPTVYSSGHDTPFSDIGMAGHSDEEIAEIFEGKRVLDIGSGAEGIARRLFKIFADSELAPRVVNLNPQLGDSWLSNSVFERIRSSMRLEEEDFDGYMKQRHVEVGVVQDLPFEDGIFDIQTSTWGFPKCIFDCWDDYYVHRLDAEAHALQGYKEILRTQAAGGIALLAPIVLRNNMLVNEVRVTRSTLKQLPESFRFAHEFQPTEEQSTVLQLRKEG